MLGGETLTPVTFIPTPNPWDPGPPGSPNFAPQAGTNQKIAANDDRLFNTVYRNGKLWTALLAVVGLQVLVVHWGPAQALFDTVSLQPGEWGMAALVASSTLLLDEARKLILRLGTHSPEEGR